MRHIKKLILFTIIFGLLSSISFGEVVQSVEVVKQEVFSSEWSENSIKAIKYNNVFDDFFYSNYQDNLTHEEACYMMVKMYEKTTSKIELEALKPEQNEYVEKAKKLGILKDIDFKKDKAITREEYAHIFRSTIELMPSGFGVKIGSTPFEQDIEKPHFEFKYRDESSIDKRYIESVHKMRLNNIVHGIYTPDTKDADGNVIKKGYTDYNPSGTVTKEEALLSIISASERAMKGVVTEPIAYFITPNNPLSSHKELFDLFEKYGNVSGGSSEYSYENSVIEISGAQIVYNGATLADLDTELSVRFYTQSKYQSSDGYVFVSVRFSAYSKNIKNIFYDIMESTLGETIAKEAVSNIAKDIELTKNGKTYNTDTLDEKIRELSNVKIEYVSGADYLECIVYFKKEFK